MQSFITKTSPWRNCFRKIHYNDKYYYPYSSLVSCTLQAICNLEATQQYQQLLHHCVSHLGLQIYSASARLRCWDWKANWVFTIWLSPVSTISGLLHCCRLSALVSCTPMEHLLVPQLDFTDFIFLDYMTLKILISYGLEALKCDLGKHTSPPAHL